MEVHYVLVVSLFNNAEQQGINIIYPIDADKHVIITLALDMIYIYTYIHIYSILSTPPPHHPPQSTHLYPLQDP